MTARAILLLLAAACYSRGSERFECWLLEHPRLGPAVRDWRRRGVIRPRAKVGAVLTIAASAVILVFSPGPPAMVKTAVLVLLAGATAYILSRPGR